MTAPTETPPYVAVVARNIRVQAAGRGVTLTEVARGLGMGQPTLAKRMSGAVAWSLADLIAVARYFEVPLSTITPDAIAE